MWWDDDPISQQIDRLLGAWREGAIPAAVAIGSTWDRDGRRVLFVGLDYRLDRRSEMWAGGRGLQDSLARALIRRFGPLPPPGRFPLGRLTFAGSERLDIASPAAAVGGGGAGSLPRVVWALLRLRRLGVERIEEVLALQFEDIDPETRAALSALEIPSDSQIAYLGPVRLVRGRGRQLFRRTGRRATVGCILETVAGTYLSTAGHLGAHAGERLFFRLRSKLGLQQDLPAGEVVAATSPATSGGGPPAAVGVDFALVRADDRQAPSLPAVKVGHASAIEDKQLLRWNGGVVGRREGWVSSILNETRGKEVRHRNTLRVMGPVSRGAAADGDSGTAVFTLDGELVGHIVGTEGYRHRAVGQAALVQDALTSFAYAESQVGSIVGVRGDCGI
jgi:hypothetical protein